MDVITASIQAFDEAVLHWAQGAIGANAVLDLFWLVVGQWLVYVVPFALVGLWLWYRYGADKRDSVASRLWLAQLAVAGILGWQVLSRLVKLFYFRKRPSVAGESVKELFFHRPDESFPSDHAALFFGFATYAYLSGRRTLGHWLLATALGVSAARIVTGTHWTTDILGGMVVGVASACIVWWLREPLKVYVLTPIERLLRQIGL
ncbi:MAG: phosphatase PAP2 family protein [Patescibacteria group bacterium]|jgi:membrane-associated phospholipid phosphatase